MKRFSVPFLLVAALRVTTGALGQTKTDIPMPDLFQLKTEAAARSTQPADVRAIAMDGPLDASAYTLGPGDLLALNIWTSTPVDQQLSVTPEGYLVIPNVGRLKVNGLTLEAARREVSGFVAKRYPRADISLILLAPRKVSVQITGQVLNEGKQEISSALRVSHLIEMADALPQTQVTVGFYKWELPAVRRQASQRLIALRRRDGTMLRVDLLKYDATGLSTYNPYLCEGDIVHVPLRKSDDNNLGVFGAVLGPTNVEFVEGDSLADLVAIGFGLKPNADPEQAWLARQSPDGNTMDTVHVNVAAVLSHQAPNIALRPGDRLVVPERPEHRRGDFVIIEGEVLLPGKYPITPFSTRLTEVIRMAGGFTSNANLSAATLLRGRPYQMGPAEEAQLEQLKSGRTSFALQDSGYYRIETQLRLTGENVSVDFGKLFLAGDSTQDVTLRDFDHIMVPFRQKSVYVFGQVVQPGHITFMEGEGYRYYIDKALGVTSEARVGDIKIIKAGTKVWLDPDETKIEDGDFIWVPREAMYPFAYYLTTWVQIAAIVGTLATVILVVRTY